jgi:hypothetical protein
MEKVIFIEAFACDEYGNGPRYAKVVIDDAFIKDVKFLSDLINTHDLSEIRRWISPDAWGPKDIEDDLRLQGGELVVVRGGTFWFSDSPKNTNYTVETRQVSIEDILKGIEAGERVFGEESNLEDLRELLAEENEIAATAATV